MPILTQICAEDNLDCLGSEVGLPHVLVLGQSSSSSFRALFGGFGEHLLS
jgi:hypothetical protein